MAGRGVPPILSLLFVMALAGLAQGQNGISIDFDRGTVSAEIRETPLSTVLERIGKEKGIWLETGFLKDESLLKEEISLEFEDIPIKEGLERILSGINHCLVFERGSVAGVMLFGRAGNAGGQRGRRTITRQRPPLRRSPSRSRSSRRP